MPHFTVLYDARHEARWFQELHPTLGNAKKKSITAAKSMPSVQAVLAHDRPDIILLDDSKPILVVEQTLEVPSGHNVGQRFARIAAAAECGVPCLYFGPYAAKKHGGKTAGPRYMNARLFKAIDVMVDKTKTAITTINWPVDKHYEVMKGEQKDKDVRAYMATFFDAYRRNGLGGINATLLKTNFHKRMKLERDAFVSKQIQNPEQYGGPPPSVKVLPIADFARQHKRAGKKFPQSVKEILRYKIEIKKLRADPYTGMAMLYKYLYLVGHRSRLLVLWFPKITKSKWHAAASRANRKDIKLFRHIADGILFSDGLLLRGEF